MGKNIFCSLPFMHLHLNTLGDVTPCCLSEFSLGNIESKSIPEIWSGQEFSALRKNILEGNPVEACSACYSVERDGATSMRQRSNAKYGKYTPLGDSYLEAPISFDVRFSNLCNLKCRTCWHGSSSAWHSDTVKLGWTQKTNPLISLDQLNPNILGSLDRYLEGAKYFYFAGGEPLVMHEHYSVLRRLIEIGNTSLVLTYNSNFTKVQYGKYNLFDLWNNFSTIKLSISIDEIDAKASYVRSGTVFSKIMENRELLKGSVRSFLCV